MRSAFAFTRLVSSALVFTFIFTQAASSYALRGTQAEEEQGVDRQDSIRVQLENALTRLASAVGWVSPAAPVPTIPAGRTVEVGLAAAGLEEGKPLGDNVPAEGDVIINPTRRLFGRFVVQPRLAVGRAMKGDAQDPVISLVKEGAAGQAATPIELRLSLIDKNARLIPTAGLEEVEGEPLLEGLFKQGDILVNLSTGNRQYRVTQDQVTSIGAVAVESLMDRFSGGSFPAAIMRTFNVVRSAAGLEELQSLTAGTQLYDGDTVYLTGDLKQVKIVASTSRAVKSRRVVLFEGEGSQAWHFQDELAAAGATFARTSTPAAGLEERVLLQVDAVPGRISYDRSIQTLETAVGTFTRTGNPVDQITWGNIRRAVTAVADNGYVELEIDGDTARIKAPSDWTLVRRMGVDEAALAINYDTNIRTLVTPVETFSRGAGQMKHLNMKHAIGAFASAGQVSWKVSGDTATVLAPAAGLEGVQGVLRKLNATTQFWKSVEVSLSITARPILIDASDDARVRHVAQALSVMLANDNVPELDFRLVIPEALVSDMIKELATINPETAAQFLSPRVIAYDGTAKTRGQARLEATQTLARRFGFGSSQQLLQAGVLKVVEQLTPQLALELRVYFELGGLRFVSSEAFERLKALLEAA